MRLRGPHTATPPRSALATPTNRVHTQCHVPSTRNTHTRLRATIGTVGCEPAHTACAHAMAHALPVCVAHCTLPSQDELRAE
eukprot:6792767-Prymnesium_polylepis.3